MHLLRPLGRRRSGRGRTCGPRAAIRIACSVASAVSGSSGLGGAHVVGLVDHDQHRLARSRRRHSRSSTAPAVSACSSRVASEPRSTTTQRGRPGPRARRAVEPAPSRGPDAAAVRRRGCARAARARSGSRALERRPRCGCSRSSTQRGQLARTPRGRRSGRAAAPPPARRAELAEAHAQRAVASGAARTATSRRPRAIALRARPRRRPRATRRAGRSPSSGRAPPRAGSSPSAAARASRRASRSCRSPTGRTGTCGGRTRPRRARHGTPGASASSPTAQRARAGRVRSSQAPTSSGLAGRTVASWNGAPSPSSTTPSPRPKRIAPAAGPAPVASSLPQLEREHLPQPSAAVALEHHVAAGLSSGRAATPGT